MVTPCGRPDLRHNGDVTTEAPTPTDYLRANAWVESDHPDVVRLGTELRAAHPDDVDFARASFEWVRDEVAHSYDVQDPRVTLSATDVLRERVGLCYAKSVLYAAVLRSQGVPAALGYQRLRSSSGGFVLHGLVSVHLEGAWHRQDPRGNKPGVDAQFSIGTENLVYRVDESLGEREYRTLYDEPAPEVVAALTGTSDVLVCQLPAELAQQ